MPAHPPGPAPDPGGVLLLSMGKQDDLGPGVRDKLILLHLTSSEIDHSGPRLLFNLMPFPSSLIRPQSPVSFTKCPDHSRPINFLFLLNKSL